MTASINIVIGQIKQPCPDQRPGLQNRAWILSISVTINKLKSATPGSIMVIQKKLERKIRRGQLAIQDHLDLHGYTQKEAIAALEEFPHRAVTAEFKLLVIIHGKGNRSGSEAVLRPLVRYWLSQQSSVLGWCPAQPKHGGNGASYVYLRV